MPTSDIIERVTEWLASLVDDPAAATEFAESPATSLANHDLSQSDLTGIDLRSVAGGLGGSGGISPQGRDVLNQFAQSAPSGGGSGGGSGSGGGGPLHEVAHVTQAAHHNDPRVLRVFEDHSQTFNVDNSQTFVNNGFVGGDINLDNDVNLATHGGVVATGNSGPVIAATGAGSQAAGGNAAQAADGSQVIQGSDVGNNANHSDGAILNNGDGGITGANSGVLDNSSLAGGDQDHGVSGRDNAQVNADDQDERDQHGQHDGRHGQDDLPFGKGDTDDDHGDQAKHGQDDKDDDDKRGDDRDGDSEKHDTSGDEHSDPTASADGHPDVDPTHGDSEPQHDQHSQHFEHQAVPDIDHDPGTDHPLDDHLLAT